MMDDREVYENRKDPNIAEAWYQEEMRLVRKYSTKEEETVCTTEVKKIPQKDIL